MRSWMYVVRLVPVHAWGETSRPSARRMLTKGTLRTTSAVQYPYRPRKSKNVDPNGWQGYHLRDVGWGSLSLATH